MRQVLGTIGCVLVSALPVAADEVPRLADALQLRSVVEIMREEGVAYAADLARDMLPGGATPSWRAVVDQIYDADRMEAVVLDGFSAALQDVDMAPVIAFFEGDLGAQIIELEISARRAMVDDTVDTTAREAFAAAEEADDPRLAELTRFIEGNDLLEANVVGGLNASYQFYAGLVDGGAFEMTESDILAEVWAQEQETRMDTREWIYAFMLLAYGPLEDTDLTAYVDLSLTEAGQAMNRGLFDGFNAMYDGISYALGLAIAQQMRATDL